MKAKETGDANTTISAVSHIAPREPAFLLVEIITKRSVRPSSVCLVLVGGALFFSVLSCAAPPAASPNQASLIGSATASLNLNTMPPPQTPSPTALQPQPTATFALAATDTPSVTTLPALQVTATPTGTSSPAASISILEDHPADGMYLTLSGPGLPANYRVGPLARGEYAVGPSGRFLAYVSNTGGVFILRLGNPHFVIVANLKRMLVAVHRDDEPLYRLSFYDADFAMFLIIQEGNYGQKISVQLPRVLVY